MLLMNALVFGCPTDSGSLLLFDVVDFMSKGCNVKTLMDIMRVQCQELSLGHTGLHHSCVLELITSGD